MIYGLIAFVTFLAGVGVVAGITETLYRRDNDE